MGTFVFFKIGDKIDKSFIELKKNEFHEMIHKLAGVQGNLSKSQFQ